jgi:hypothetical protein
MNKEERMRGVNPMKKVSILFNFTLIGLLVLSTAGKDIKTQDVKNPGLNVKQGHPPVTTHLQTIPDPGDSHLYFIPNQGQVNNKAIFYAKTTKYILWLTKEGLVFDSVKKVKVEAEAKEEAAPFGQIINAFDKDTNKNVPGKVPTPDIHASVQSCNHASMQYQSHSPYSPYSTHSTKIHRDVSRLIFLNTKKDPVMVPMEETKHRVNYFKGNDQSKWHFDIPTSGAILYKNIYKNIDLKIYGIEKQVEYDWMVKPGGNPGDIKFEYKNVKKTRVDNEGNLVIETDFGCLMHKRPVGYQAVNGNYKLQNTNYKQCTCLKKRQVQNDKSQITNKMLHSAALAQPGTGVPETDRRGLIYQTRTAKNSRKSIDVTFKKIGKNTYGFAVGEYDKQCELIIDPVVLAYSTYLGGNGWEEISSTAVDEQGYVYAAGSTWSTDFPVQGQYQTDPGIENYDAFVSKIDASKKGQSSLIYSTYLGGLESDGASGIAVDDKGNVYITGQTWSEDFPTSRSYQTYQGEGDVFVTKIDTTRTGASSLVYSTYLGGIDEEKGLGIAADSKGNVYITGWTYSLDFPNRNPYQAEAGKDFSNAFVTQIDTSKSGTSSLIYSTYLGGKSSDAGNSIAVDGSGLIYVTGWTYSPDFPTMNPFQPDKGNVDAFVTRLDPSRSGTAGLLYSTYLGGGKADYGESIDLDGNNNGYVYITGITRSTDFPTRNSFQKYQGDADAFVTELDTTKTGSSCLLYSTYLGGENSDSGYGIAVDSSSGDVYITGVTESSNFPAYRSYQGHQGGEDAFITQLDTTRAGSSSLIFSTFLGGKNTDGGLDIAVDSSSNIYVTGWTLSTDFPVLNQYRGDTGDLDYDGFIAKLFIEPDAPPSIRLSRTGLDFSAIIGGVHTGPQPLSIGNSGGGGLDWTASTSAAWLTIDPVTGADDTILTVSVVPDNLSPGSTAGTITVTDPGADNSPQTVNVTLTVYQPHSTTPPFGEYSTPIDGSTVSSSIPVTGWVLDDIGVESVKIYRGEGKSLVYIGDAVFVEGARPDIEAAYPGYPMNYRAGWGYMMLTNFLPNSGNGTFQIYAVAMDTEGKQVSLGTKTIIVDNANAVKPFGAIDTPTQGGIAAGSGFINWGWVLTPQPNSIPTDGSTINVWVDGVNLGHPTYNIYRSDIAQLFPGYNNSSGAAGYFTLDTTAYANGIHTIQWTATDDAGNTDGIGSRYFAIQNTGNVSGVHSRGQGGLPPCFPPDSSPDEPIYLEKGYNKNIRPQRIYPDENGLITIEIEELERLEIRLTPGNTSSYRYTGYLAAGNGLKALPIGSTFDRVRGVFSWQPGAGFIGNYRLVFTEETAAGYVTGRNILITITPKSSARKD